jgi:hypothetical protein
MSRAAGLAPDDMPDEGTADFWESRPNLARIRDFARSRAAGPWAVLGVVLARVVAGADYRVVLPALAGGDASLNIFVALVGPSGGGKGVASRAAEELTYDVETVGIGSGEGIAHAFGTRKGSAFERTAHNILVDIPEVDTLAGVAGRKGSTLLPELRKAWSGEALGFQYADKAKRLPIGKHSYRLGVVVGVQPARAGVLLEDVDGGTPQRYVWLPVNDPDAPREPPVVRAEELKLTEAKWHHAWNDPNRLTMTVCDAIRDEFDAANYARLTSEKGAGLDGHALLGRLKIAAALALVSSDTPEQVTEEDWRLAAFVMDVSDDTRAKVTEAARLSQNATNKARGEFDADRAVVVDDRLHAHQVNRVAGVILGRAKRAGEQSGSQLRKSVQAKDRGLFEEALQQLLDAGDLATVAANRYKAA